MASHENTEPMERRIWIYGNPDKSKDGFQSPGELTDYISRGIFDDEECRYRYTQSKDADIIVLSRDGKAFGHFDIDHKEKPNKSDRELYPRVRFVYLVRKSTLYTTPVPLSNLSIKKIQWGKKMTEAEFAELQKLAGGALDVYGPKALPQSTVELEKTLQE